MMPSVSGSSLNSLDDIEVARAVDRVAADADGGRLAEALRGELEDGLVGESAGAGDDADMALLVDVAGGDADAAAAVALVAGAGRDEAGAVGPDEAGLLACDGALHADHVLDRNALGDADDEVEAGVDALEDGVGGEWRRDEDHARPWRRSRRRLRATVLKIGTLWPACSKNWPPLPG